MFPLEITGTMIFILGVNLVPTGFKYFLGPPEHIAVVAITLLMMLCCALFIKPLRPYTALAGIMFGYILAATVGVFNISELAALKSQSVVALHFYRDLPFAFDIRLLMPFLIITVAAVVDNIGDFSASQRANGDGMTDLLIYRGSFGPRLVSHYDCYLGIGSIFVRYKGFDEIPEPAVEDGRIIGSIHDGLDTVYFYEYKVRGFAVELQKKEVLELTE